MKRMGKHAFLVFVAVGCLSVGSAAQDDPWWKKLFKKETVNELESSDPQEEEMPPATFENEPEAIDSLVIPSFTMEPGVVSIQTPGKLDSLDARQLEDPLPIKGYRIQIFYGNYDNARSERSKYMSEHDDDPCYLVNNNPNFAVRVGDFRTELDAHRQLNEIKGQYPFAYVVPDQIEFPELISQ